MSEESSLGLTARELELLAKAMLCTKEPVTIDYQKFAEAGDFKNANSAKASWHAVKKKLDKVASGRTPTKRSKSADADDQVDGTPRKKSKAKSRTPDSDEDGGDRADSGCGE